MPSRDTPRTPHPGAPIRTPDQVQQAKRPDARPARPARPAAERPEEAPAGVLGQLRSERAHD